MPITRRELAAALVSAPALAQSAPAQSTPAQSTPDELLKAAHDRIRANGEALARIELPMATEPAFQFKA